MFAELTDARSEGLFFLPEAIDGGVGRAAGFAAHIHEGVEIRVRVEVFVLGDGSEEHEVALGGDALVVAVLGVVTIANGVEPGLDRLAAAVAIVRWKLDGAHEGTVGDFGESQKRLVAFRARGDRAAEPDFAKGLAGAIEDFDAFCFDGAGDCSGCGARLLCFEAIGGGSEKGHSEQEG